MSYKTRMLLAVCLSELCIAPLNVWATTITVTNTNDSGPGSLRQALADANDGDIINLAITGTIGLTSGELLVDRSITISGPGADNLLVNGNAKSRVFHIGPSETVTISGLTTTNGNAHGEFFPDVRGGGLYNDHATLTLTNCSVVANVASYGGGIYNDGYNGSAVLTIVDSAINDNSSTGGDSASGGRIANDGSVALTILNSTISGNSAVGQFPFTFGSGGGIDGAGTITNSTISGNYAGTGGGGISGGGIITNSTISNNGAGGGKNNFPGAGGGIYGGGTISNCTISGNSVFGTELKGPGVGAGIYAVGTLTIRNSTVSDNLGLFYGNGAGIYNGGTLTIENSTLSNNSATQGGGIYNGGSIGIGNTILNGGMLRERTSSTTGAQSPQRVTILVATMAVVTYTALAISSMPTRC